MVGVVRRAAGSATFGLFLRAGFGEAAGFDALTAFTGFFTGAFFAVARTTLDLLAAGLAARVAGFFATAFFTGFTARRTGFAATFLAAARGLAAGFGLAAAFTGFALTVAEGLAAFFGGAL